MLLTLHHVQLAIPTGDADKARAFRGNLPGLTEVAKPAGLWGRGGAWVEPDGSRLHPGVEELFLTANKAHPR
jgi:catechol 2,3-dioxygenase-like lactoylglutathione lyase family enzyme